MGQVWASVLGSLVPSELDVGLAGAHRSWRLPSVCTQELWHRGPPTYYLGRSCLRPNFPEALQRSLPGMAYFSRCQLPGVLQTRHQAPEAAIASQEGVLGCPLPSYTATRGPSWHRANPCQGAGHATFLAHSNTAHTFLLYPTGQASVLPRCPWPLRRAAHSLPLAPLPYSPFLPRLPLSLLFEPRTRAQPQHSRPLREALPGPAWSLPVTLAGP